MSIMLTSDARYIIGKLCFVYPSQLYKVIHISKKTFESDQRASQGSRSIDGFGNLQLLKSLECSAV